MVRDRAFLANARAQLDADHFGLEKIKKRLIEYLAVVRLKQLNAEREAQAAEEERRREEAAMAAAIAAKRNPESDSTAGKDLQRDLQLQQPISIPNHPKAAARAVKGPILLYVLFP